MSMMMVYVTFADLEEARRLSHDAVKGGLVACVNIFPSHEAMYWWDGAVQNDVEVAVIYKTESSLYQDLEVFVKARHSADTPCIVAWDVTQGSEDFLAWAHFVLHKT